jgi:hypothetical protein
MSGEQICTSPAPKMHCARVIEVLAPRLEISKFGQAASVRRSMPFRWSLDVRLATQHDPFRGARERDITGNSAASHGSGQSS